MRYVKENALARVDAQAITKFLTLASVATVLPFLIHVQWLTGPIVNAILIVTLFLVGIRSALVLCLIPSLMALSGGLLPAILAPVVPFVMISNVILVLSIETAYSYFKNVNYGYTIGVLVGAGLKFLFLFSSVSLISKLVLKQELAVKIAQIMSWPQFATAVIGGMLAWILLKWLKRL